MTNNLSLSQIYIENLPVIRLQSNKILYITSVESGQIMTQCGAEEDFLPLSELRQNVNILNKDEIYNALRDAYINQQMDECAIDTYMKIT